MQALRDRPGASQFLLALDPATKRVQITGYNAEESAAAFNDYVAAERPDRAAPRANVVLVSVDSIDALRSAYPNYYGDATAFVGVLGDLLGWYWAHRGTIL